MRARSERARDRRSGAGSPAFGHTCSASSHSGRRTMWTPSCAPSEPPHRGVTVQGASPRSLTTSFRATSQKRWTSSAWRNWLTHRRTQSNDAFDLGCGRRRAIHQMTWRKYVRTHLGHLDRAQTECGVGVRRVLGSLTLPTRPPMRRSIQSSWPTRTIHTALAWPLRSPHIIVQRSRDSNDAKVLCTDWAGWNGEGGPVLR